MELLGQFAMDWTVWCSTSGRARYSGSI